MLAANEYLAIHPELTPAPSCRIAINWRPAKTWGEPRRGDKLSHLVGRLWRHAVGGQDRT
jgi:hypothetical protein